MTRAINTILCTDECITKYTFEKGKQIEVVVSFGFANENGEFTDSRLPTQNYIISGERFKALMDKSGDVIRTSDLWEEVDYIRKLVNSKKAFEYEKPNNTGDIFPL